jgi:phosphoribosylanthranilate isomerase
VILAGGLTAENVAEAIRFVRPAGVDSHTGVEDATGRKDRDKVARFVAAARAAWAELDA